MKVEYNFIINCKLKSSVMIAYGIKVSFTSIKRIF